MEGGEGEQDRPYTQGAHAVIDLVNEISVARDAVARLEVEASDAGHKLRLSKEKLRKARQELDTLLVELVSGESRYPLFPAETAGNGQDATPQARPTQLRFGRSRPLRSVSAAAGRKGPSAMKKNPRKAKDNRFTSIKVGNHRQMFRVIPGCLPAAKLPS